MTHETTGAIPNPGSQEAAAQGCTCAVIDNHYGRGVAMPNGSVNFWISGDCPVHAMKGNATSPESGAPDADQSRATR
jgi:hypothetical protein